MFASPPRHRDRHPRYDDFYTDYDRQPRRMSPGPPPRRHKSERHRRPPSPDYESDPRSRRRGDDRRRARSPPSYTTEPRRGHTTRDAGRRRTHDDYDRRPRQYDDYDDRRGGRNRHDEPRHRARSPPPAYEKHRSSDQRPRGRDREDKDRSHGKSDRRHRSHGNSPTRGRATTSGTKSGGGTTRRKSMPASTKTKGPGLGAMLGAAGGGGGSGGQWWQNPMIQAGARTAFAAGAQAAMNNRNAQGDWLGAKGAKVATAALGAALMDGFMGGGGKRDLSPEPRKDDGGKGRRDSSGGKGKSGGGMKEKLLSQGLNFLSNRASGRH